MDSETQRKARQGQIDFHRREMLEGPERKPPMPPEQVEIHRRQLEVHVGLLATEQTAKVIHFPTERARSNPDGLPDGAA